MVDEKLIKIVQSTFSIYGLVLSRTLSISVAKQLSQVNEDEQENWLTGVVERVLSQNLENPHVEVDHIRIAITDFMRSDVLKETETKLNVIDAYDIPKITYDLNKKKFVLHKSTMDLYSDVTQKTILFKDRFETILYRILRHELFTSRKLGEKNVSRIKLTPIESLYSESKTRDICLLGLIAEFSENHYYLEDPGGALKIDLRHAIFQDGLIMEGSMVLVSGTYTNGVLYVKEIGFPPPESSDNSRADFGDANTFGGPHPTSLKLSEKLKVYEESNQNGMIIFLSDLWLDNSVVLSKFKIMLDGLVDIPPIAFVICGNFLSFPENEFSPAAMKEGFKKLADLIVQYPTIKTSSKFIFVPGPCDLGAPKILPRRSLSKYVVEDIQKAIPEAIFATNPCRIQYCTKEIVVYREDILIKMCRNTLRFPSGEESKVPNHFAKSIICQAHLVPLTLTASPVYWTHDYALRLHPTPDLIVVADKYEPYSTVYSNCHVINPGSFPNNKFSFKTYVPAANIIEDCEIPSTQ
ncbi:DNA polymerase epsilon subunit 2-like isoform X1 [Vespa mandarinia]|uniref:DNA polymerase epsilon subunit 2-like isoform X1 n=1 Tax=Vespa mandarinia TaxID=7446 RepID=UPI0016193D6C|nr:DNA polymerase epsilon subunit 2-like isoform X1 [Vespa mandarinia]